MSSHELAVGEPFPGLSFPVPDAGEYLYYDAGHELRLFWSRPAAREVESVRKGEAEFGLLYEEGLVCLAYRFGAEPVSEAMYTWHLVPEERRQMPSETIGQERALLTAVLTDAASGIVEVMRGITFSPAFTAALHGCIQEQVEGTPISMSEYFERARKIQERYPTSDALMAAAEVTTIGGE